MNENDFKKRFGSNSPLPPYNWDDDDYASGWNITGDMPPTRQQFDALQRTNDDKAAYLLDKVYSSARLLRRSTHYNKGDRVYAEGLKAGLYLECATAGMSGTDAIDFSSSNVGDTITDGGVTWTVVKYVLTTDVPPLASALATPRKIELTGNVTGSADFDGSKNIQIVTATPLCVPLAEHITWTVTGTDQGDFDSLQTALDEAKKYRPIAEGALITIKLLSGFELDEPIRVSRCDLRHVEITAEDSKVIANTSKVAALMPTVPNYSPYSGYLFYIQFYKAFAPTIRFKLRKDNNNGSGYNQCAGIDYNYAQGYIDGGGCENFKIGGNESYGVNITCSNLSVLDSTFSDCWGGVTTGKNSSLLVRNSTFTDFLDRGIALWGGVGEIQGCTINGKGTGFYGILFAHCEASISEYNTESDSPDTRRTMISNCSRGGVAFYFGGTAAINRVDITGCTTGVLFEGSGNLVRIGADTNISGNTNNYSVATNTITSQGLILTA